MSCGRPTHAGPAVLCCFPAAGGVAQAALDPLRRHKGNVGHPPSPTRRSPLNTHRITLGVAAAVMLVILRLGLGFHFLYEGVWKIKNAERFSAAPFLSEAKGPVAPLFYAMLPDLEGRQRLGITFESGKPRLAIETDAQGNPVYEQPKDASGKVLGRWPKYRLSAYLDAWKDLAERTKVFYQVRDEQAQAIDALLERYASSARQYVADHAEEILAHFESRQRFENSRGHNQALYQRQREWDRERELRREVNTWLSELESLGRQFQQAVASVLDAEQKARGAAVSPWNPLHWSRLELLNFSVTYGLSAIGLCLILGFFTRLAALGGAAFMAFVVMTQPAWPGLYPPDPPVVGHALLVNKDFVEMLALWVIATTYTGRWAGLDFFVHRLVGRCCRKPASPAPQKP